VDLHEIVKGTSDLRRKKRRIGRGPGSGSGKSAGRGIKGLGARSGAGLPPWYEGGATPGFRRFPKKGFSNTSFEKSYELVNIGALKKFDGSAEVGPAELKSAGLVRGKAMIKLLGKGVIDKAVTVKVHAASAEAKNKLEAAGGKLVILEK